MEAGNAASQRQITISTYAESDEDHEDGDSLALLGLDYRHSDEHKNSSYQGPDYGRSHIRDRSRWLRPVSLIFALLILATIAISTSITLFRKPSLHPEISSFPTHNGGKCHGPQRTLGIDLHPELHALRTPRTLTYQWRVTSGFRSPDGVKKEVYFINDAFPGPTIECRTGDRLRIHVTNALPPGEGLSIHWHGLHMRNANDMDGAVGFTQSPIPVGQVFTYEFEVEQAGTFWWHAHSQVQRGDGFFGGLVVHATAGTHSNEMEIYGYEKESLLLIGDWYHRSAQEVLEWYTSVRAFGNEPVPDSLLINGAGRFNCSMALPARPVECVDIEDGEFPALFEPALVGGMPKRIRIVNVGSLAGFTVRIGSGNLTPISVDGGFPVTGHAADSVGILYPGERVDLLLKWNENANSQDPRLHVSLDPENFKYPNEALNPNQSFPITCSTSGTPDPTQIPSLAEEYKPLQHLDLATVTARHLSNTTALKIPLTSHQTILLYTKTQKLSRFSNHPMGFINRTSWAPQAIPPLPLLSLPREDWDANQFVPWIPTTSTNSNDDDAATTTWIDIIINNLDDGSHPFHLHGYSFYVLASHRSEQHEGWGSYSPYTAAGTASAVKPALNLDDPVRKDTVSVPRRGYVVLRLRADNPGIWMLHCHVLFHQASGMAMGLLVGDDEEAQ